MSMHGMWLLLLLERGSHSVQVAAHERPRLLPVLDSTDGQHQGGGKPEQCARVRDNTRRGHTRLRTPEGWHSASAASRARCPPERRQWCCPGLRGAAGGMTPRTRQSGVRLQHLRGRGGRGRMWRCSQPADTPARAGTAAPGGLHACGSRQRGRGRSGARGWRSPGSGWPNGSRCPVAKQ